MATLFDILLLLCRQEGREFKLKLADVNLALGEVGLESGVCLLTFTHAVKT